MNNEEVKNVMSNESLTAVELVLRKWEHRIQDIQTQMEFVNQSTNDKTSPAARELMTLVNCTKELRAAIVADKGDVLEVFRIFLENR